MSTDWIILDSEGDYRATFTADSAADALSNTNSWGYDTSEWTAVTTDAYRVRVAARHALAVWEGTETHIDAQGFPVIGMMERAELLARALRGYCEVS